MKTIILLLVAFSSFAQFQLVRQPDPTTVAALPTASTNTRRIYIVTDGTSASDCTTGGGSTRAICISNGTTWTATAGGAGSITGCGTGMTLNGTVCDVNTAVIPSQAILQSGAPVYCAGSASTTSTCSLTPTLTAYTTGMVVTFKAGATNTTTNTLNIDSLGAKSILSSSGGALAAGDITSGRYYDLTYDGTQFLLPAAPTSTAPNFSQVFYVGMCTTSGGTFTRLFVMDSTSGTQTCYSGFPPTYAALAVTGVNQNATWAIPVATAVSSLKVGGLVYANSTNNGTVQVQTACIANGATVGSPSYSTGANTIAFTSAGTDAMMANYATNSVTCSAGSLLMVRLNWSAIVGTQNLVGVHIQW
jgi:hypothetical protein